ncbi:YajD family HNH nuclease [Candidatus Nitrotoga sp. M5]|uniref:YajD family HNH nuclease n=1 Tax=Candidatus Nitrotoga sp. M5 TaxID=2890409 RepID=UPI001F912BD6|nr:YajD family HNH nuclease [Candidatus Nitrotoga sp. M5]CAH1386271.1 HNH nuclease family protein YajD [Candidatus Nitrotoga sp. M5]
MNHYLNEIIMTIKNSKLDKIVLDARINAEKRTMGYREQALKMYPWVCGRCARTFSRENLQLLEVHHKNHNHDYNPTDGSNWELLCTYCHENEHSRVKDSAGRSAAQNPESLATFNPFADLKNILKK